MKPEVRKNLRRGVFVIPTIFTMLNLFFGFRSVINSMLGIEAITTNRFDLASTYFEHAAWMLFIAAVFDTFDGLVARGLGATSEFGKEYDSLADMVTFGAAPAVLVYAWGLHVLGNLGAGIAFLLLTDRRRTRIVLVGGLIALTTMVVVIRADPTRFEQALFSKQAVASHNVTTRLEAWNAAANLAADHPLLGIGPGNFRFYYYQATGNPPGTEILAVVHDAYLDVAAELGFVAAIAFLLYLGLSFSRLTGAIRAGAGSPEFAQTVRLSLVIAAVAALFISEQYFLPFWLLGGLATALSQERVATPE